MTHLNRFFLVVFAFGLFGASAQADFGPRDCYKHRYDREGFAWDARRGSPSDFDPGPAAEESQSWLELYGQLPNYRSIGKAILGGSEEKFRWQMGPMWYRGRLGKNKVKVFVVGQEGAQDENVTNRAFTGSTGTRVQKFLNHLGIYESYLYMNTYVYTIKGQRITDEAEWGYKNYVALEQGAMSPIVQYRHMLFDNVIKQNPESIALLMAVGGGGKASLANWINTRSGNDECKEWALEWCDTSGVVEHFVKQGVLEGDEKIVAVGVQHPGGAAFGDGFERIQKSFDEAAGSVAYNLKTYPGWLPADPQESQFGYCNGGDREERLEDKFQYGHAPVPFKDFSFATNWRMGDKGTTSNRDGATRIQVFSEQGRYAIVRIPEEPLGDVQLSSGRTVFNDTEPAYVDYQPPREAEYQLRDEYNGLLYGMKDNEVANEHPRYKSFGDVEGDLSHVQQFDPGPATEETANALMDWPNFQEIDESAYKSNESFGFGPSYRGNSKDPEVIILADQMGHTDFFSTRALTGEAGQMLQTFLNKTGLEDSSSYLILRPLPVDTIGVATDKKVALAMAEDANGKSAVKTLEKVLKTLGGGRKQLVAMGPVATAMSVSWVGKMQELNLKSIYDMQQPDRGYNHVANWVELAGKLGLDAPAEGELKGLYIIPRKDLPYSTRWWMGSTGERADRAYGMSLYEKQVNNREFDYTGHYYRLIAPDWIWNIKDDDPRPLTELEKSLVETVLDNHNL